MLARSSAPAGPVRWAVNVTDYQPSQQDLADVLTLLPEFEQRQCQSFHRLVDCKRALISRLLQRKLGLAVHDKKHLADVNIARTARGKPYFAHLPGNEHAPNLNFNVSHEV